MPTVAPVWHRIISDIVFALVFFILLPHRYKQILNHASRSHDFRLIGTSDVHVHGLIALPSCVGFFKA
jgi:hypothetical protein